MLTPEQLEAAARKLCEIRGKNPDEETQFGYFDWDTKRVTPITWLKACENEIRAHLEIQEAVQSIPQPSKPRIGICSCGHREDRHSVVRDSVGQVERCRECSCWIYLEDTGATIEANKQP